MDHRTTDAMADLGTSERPDSPRRSGQAWRGQVGSGQAFAQGIQGRPPAGLGGGADLLRNPVDIPGLLVLISLLGLLGKSATQPVITGLTKAAPGSVCQIVLNAMLHLQHSHATAGILAAVGIVVGLWSGPSAVLAEHRHLT